MKRLLHAFRHSLDGIAQAIRSEAAFRQEAIAFVVAVPVAALLAESLATFALLVGALLFLMVVELLNTAIEAACNGLSRDYMDEIKIAKDCGSAAVLLSIILTGGIWLTVLVYRFFL